MAPGLYPNEKKVALPFVLVSTSLFLTGGWFGHTVVFPVIFAFFASFSSSFVEAAWTMREVFGFSTRMLLAFGTGFELPVVVFFLAFAGHRRAAPHAPAARSTSCWSPSSWAAC